MKTQKSKETLLQTRPCAVKQSLEGPRIRENKQEHNVVQAQMNNLIPIAREVSTAICELPEVLEKPFSRKRSVSYA